MVLCTIDRNSIAAVSLLLLNLQLLLYSITHLYLVDSMF